MNEYEYEFSRSAIFKYCTFNYDDILGNFGLSLFETNDQSHLVASYWCHSKSL